MRCRIVLLLALATGCTARRLPDPDEITPALAAQREARAEQEAEQARELAKAKRQGYD
ncbi:cytochrome c biogenesis protein ResB [Limnoglobus roseus]|uniref:Lipoprotein n=1 Tax=Limnoglobus roseus TaxID=2598579 RepID=A0A5C1AFK6_9BACT|nr:cytochrome c biogenesis protein ResB [Limnoglobus roseus]QEL17600.1 hypothetical protein PX52LOC_04596 [Limnoglobus roseus]